MIRHVLTFTLAASAVAAASAQPIACDLRQCIEIALTQSPAQKEAQAGVEYARALHQVRLAESRPLVGAEANAGYFDGNRISPFDLLTRNADEQQRRAHGAYGQAILNVDVPLFAEGAFVPWGSRGARVAELGIAEQQGRADLRRQDITEAVARAYQRLAAAAAARSVLERILQLRSGIAALARQQVTGELAPRRDLLRAQAREAEARRDLALNAIEVQRATSALAIAMGVPAQGLSVKDEPIAMPAVQSRSPEELVDSALRQSPQVRAAQAGVARSNEELARAMARNSPEVALRLAARRGEDLGSRGGATQYEAVVQLKIPLVDFGRADAATDAARAQLVAAEAKLDDARARVTNQVLDLRQDVSTLEEETRLLQAKLDESEEEVRLTRSLVRENLATQAALSELEVTQLQVRRAHSDAVRLLGVARLRLDLMVGS